MAESIALNPPQPVGSPSDKSLCPQPVGFPPRLTSLLAWHPKELLAKRDQTILELQPSDLVEIKAAVAHFNGMDARNSDAPCSPAHIYRIWGTASRIVACQLSSASPFSTFRSIQGKFV